MSEVLCFRCDTVKKVTGDGTMQVFHTREGDVFMCNHPHLCEVRDGKPRPLDVVYTLCPNPGCEYVSLDEKRGEHYPFCSFECKETALNQRKEGAVEAG